MKQRIISALLRIYPAAWRKEYGAEFRDLLEALQLRVRTVANVVWNGVCQRLRATEPWLLLGLPSMLLQAVAFAVRVVSPPPYSPMADIDHPSGFGMLISVLVIAGCGLWTVARSGGTLPHAGLQTMKMGILANVPYLIVAVLLVTGALGLIVIGPGDAPTTFAEHGFAVTFYSAERATLNLPAMLLALIVGAPCAHWLAGTFGGAVGRLIKDRLWPAR